MPFGTRRGGSGWVWVTLAVALPVEGIVICAFEVYMVGRTTVLSSCMTEDIKYNKKKSGL